jgi:hypothetical protein
MAADPVVLAALVKALEADPESAPIRLHLAALLIESGGEASAMDHVLQVLNRDPTNVEAIGLAAQAADALGSILVVIGILVLSFILNAMNEVPASALLFFLALPAAAVWYVMSPRIWRRISRSRRPQS